MNAACKSLNMDTMQDKLLLTRARATTLLPSALRAVEDDK